MNIFVTGITGLDPDRTTTCERVRTNWAKGLKGKPLSAERRAKISAALKGRPLRPRSAETRAKMSAALKGRPRSAETRAAIGAASAKPIHTPLGIFASRNLAAQAYNCDGSLIHYRLKKFPKDYYYITKEAK